METENQESAPMGEEQDTLESRVITFSVNDAAIAQVAEDFKEVDAYQDFDGAKLAKKTLTTMRTALGDAHKEAKAGALAYGRRCDDEKNRLLKLIGTIEDPITEQLTEIKTAAARAEQDRLDKIQEGLDQIDAFAMDRHDLTLDQLNERLDTLLKLIVEEDHYEEHTEAAKGAKEVSESKLRIAIMNEENRLKEAEDQALIAKENAELKKKMAKLEADQAEKDAAQKVIDDAAAAEQKVKDDERQAELDAQQAEIDKEKQEIADADAERLAEERKQQARIAQAKADEEAAALAALQAPDIDKLIVYADHIETIISQKPVMGTTAGHSAMLDTVALLIQSHEQITTHIEEMK